MSLEPVVGSGPYVIDKVEPGTRISFKRNPNYWGNNLAVKKGMDNFDTISIDYFKDETTQFEAFKKGLFDVYPEGDPAKWASNYAFPAVADGTVLSAWGKARGDADNPVQRADVVEKFSKVTAGRLSAAKQAEVIALCEKLDSLDDISVLLNTLQT